MVLVVEQRRIASRRARQHELDVGAEAGDKCVGGPHRGQYLGTGRSGWMLAWWSPATAIAPAKNTGPHATRRPRISVAERLYLSTGWWRYNDTPFPDGPQPLFVDSGRGTPGATPSSTRKQYKPGSASGETCHLCLDLRNGKQTTLPSIKGGALWLRAPRWHRRVADCVGRDRDRQWLRARRPLPATRS